jgi:photosystem II stability/assembly factor-like uncharacterized protein
MVGWMAGYTSEDVQNSWPRNGTSSLYKSDDGGLNWKKVDIESDEPFFDRLYFFDRSLGLVTAQNKVFLTLDGGESWQPFVEFSSDGSN